MPAEQRCRSSITHYRIVLNSPNSRLDARAYASSNSAAWWSEGCFAGKLLRVEYRATLEACHLIGALDGVATWMREYGWALSERQAGPVAT